MFSKMYRDNGNQLYTAVSLCYPRLQQRIVIRLLEDHTLDIVDGRVWSENYLEELSKTLNMPSHPIPITMSLKKRRKKLQKFSNQLYRYIRDNSTAVRMLELYYEL